MVNAALFLFSVYLSAVLADVGLYFVHAKPAMRHPQNMYRPDDDRGFRLAASFRGSVNTNKPYMVETNSRGYRDLEWESEAKVRVLVVGDSYTFGSGLPMELGFVAQARGMAAGRAWFFNGGVGGYGVPHSLETLRKECRYVRATPVFYMYYLNDTRRDNMDTAALRVVDGFLVPAKARDDRRVLTTGEIRRRIEERRRQKSWELTRSLRLLNLRKFLSWVHFHPRQLSERIFSIDDLSEEYLRRYVVSSDSELYPPRLAGRAAEMIAEMAAEAADCGARFAMFVLPSYQESYYGVAEPATNRLLKSLAGRVKVVDLRKFTKKGENLTLSEEGDYHYNQDATRFVARHMLRAADSPSSD